MITQDEFAIRLSEKLGVLPHGYFIKAVEVVNREITRRSALGVGDSPELQKKSTKRIRKKK